MTARVPLPAAMAIAKTNPNVEPRHHGRKFVLVRDWDKVVEIV
jgi:hypothetical protein